MSEKYAEGDRVRLVHPATPGVDTVPANLAGVVTEVLDDDLSRAGLEILALVGLDVDMDAQALWVKFDGLESDEDNGAFPAISSELERE